MLLRAISIRPEHLDTVRIEALAIAVPSTLCDPSSKDVQRISHTRYAVY